jgi:HEAT repeat protein
MARVILVWALAPCLALSGCGGPSNPEGQSLTDWQRDLDGASPEGRRRAVEALQRVGLRAIPMFVGPDAKAAVPALRDALGDSRPLVRMLADEALRRIDADD